VVVDEPPDAKRIGVADLLVRLQRHDDVAVGSITLLFISDEVRDERRRHEFVVGGAAAVVVAVFLGQFERVERPVGKKRLDHVEMSKQQDRLSGAGAAQSRHQISLARRRLEHLHVSPEKPAVRSRAAMASAARPVSPVAVTVLISTNSL